MLFFSLCASWFLGLLLARPLPLILHQWLALAGLAALALALYWRFVPYRILFSALLILFAGAARLESQLPPVDSSHVSFYNDLRAEIRLTGVIASDPEDRETYTRFVLRVERIRIAELEIAAPLEGLVLVHASRLVEWSYGDWVRVRGNLETPPSELDFDYASVLANEGIYSWMPSASVDLLEHGHGSQLLGAIYRLRASLLRTILRVFPDPEAQLMAGILLGIEGGISPSTREAFNRTGTTHIIAISGFNLTLIAQASMRISGRSLGRRRGAIAAIGVILIYTVMVGADPPVVRAAIMATLGLIAAYLGRVSQALRSLGLAAVIMTLINPLSLFEVGFQLSFAATLGLILYAEPLQQAVQRMLEKLVDREHAERIGPLLGEYALFTLAAQLTTLPITVVAFHRLSLVSILANIFVLPLQPGLMLTGGLAMLTGAISQPLGQAVAWIAWPFPAATIRLASAFARLPLGSLQLKRLSFAFPLLYYASLLGITLGIRWIQTRKNSLTGQVVQVLRRALASVPLLSVLLVIALLSWHGFIHLPDGRLHMSLLDVGEGDALLIQAPDAGTILIDGGGSSLRLNERLSPYFSIYQRRLDWLILAGDEYGQLAGLIGLQDRYPAAQALLYSDLSGSAGRRLLEEFNQAGLPRISAVPGARLDLGSGASLRIIDSGPNGLALALEYGAFHALLLPGADPEMIGRLDAGNFLNTWTVLMLPACGDPRLVPPEWLAGRNSLLLLSCGGGQNPALAGPVVRGMLRTDLHGDIELVSDGSVLWVNVERKP